MIDSQLISFLHGLGIKIPENNPNPRGFFLQLLKDQEVKDDSYLPWAVEKYQIPLLKNEFFAGFQPQSQIWEANKASFEWDEGFLPLFQWEDKLVIGCVDLPQKYVERQEHVLILCSILELEKVWNFYQAPQAYRFIDQLGIQPADPQPVLSEAPVLELDELTIPPTAEPVAQTETAEQKPALSVSLSNAPAPEAKEEDPAALLQLADEEDSSSEKTSEESEGESSEEESSPDGLSMEASEGAENLSLDLSVPPPKLSLTPLSSNSTEAATSNEVPTVPPPVAEEKVEAKPAATLKPLLSPVPKQEKPDQPPPPPQNVSLAPTKPPVAPTPAASAAEAKVIPMKNERFINFSLMKELSFSEVQNTVEQIFIDYQAQNKVGFFGFVDQDKRKIDFAFRSKGQIQQLESPAIMIDQAGILNIVLRTQKPFYGKPYSSEQNLKLYEIVNDGIDPDMIMVVPFVIEEKIIAVVGFVADESSYSLERLMEYEIRVQREFRIKLGLSITNLEKAS